VKVREGWGADIKIDYYQSYDRSGGVMAERRKQGLRTFALVVGVFLSAVGAFALFETLGSPSLTGKQLFDVPGGTTGKDAVVAFRAWWAKKYVIHAKAALPPGVWKDGSFAECARAQADRLCSQIKNVSWSLAVIDASGGKPDIWMVVPDGYVVDHQSLWMTLGFFETERFHSYSITSRFNGLWRQQYPVRLIAYEAGPYGVPVGATLIEQFLALGVGTAATFGGLIFILVARPWSLWRQVRG